jgi:hypothetical protein
MGGQCRNYLWFIFELYFYFNIVSWWMCTGTVHIFHGWAMPELEDPVRYRNKSISNWERGVSYGTFWPKAKASFLKPINYAFLCFPARSKGLHTCVWRSLDSERIDLQFDAYKRTIRLLYKEIRESTESVATLPPFSPIEGQKWFDQVTSQWESQKNRFALIYFGKIQFLPTCIWNLPFMSAASVQHDWSLERERERSISSQIHCPWLGG